MTTATKPKSRRASATFSRETRQFARFDLDEPYTGSVYVPLEQWQQDGKPEQLTLTLTAASTQ